jgi:hypothetical protein
VIPSESQIAAAVVDHWRAAGMPLTRVFSIPNAGALGQPGLTKGAPDLCVMAPGLPVGFIELKKDLWIKRDGSLGERRTKEQVDFAIHCSQLNIPYALCSGRDEPIEQLRRWGVIR